MGSHAPDGRRAPRHADHAPADAAEPDGLRQRLKARALGLIARREHSPEEMRRKLRESLRRRAAAEPGEPGAADAESAEALIDPLIDWLIRLDLLSEQRFVAGRVQARSGRHGSPRIRQELARHGLAPDAAQWAQLRSEDLAHAQALWQRRYGTVSAEPAERARQMRFLASRGFPLDVVRRVVEGRAPIEADDPD